MIVLKYIVGGGEAGQEGKERERGDALLFNCWLKGAGST
jgi:hypothetical protein